jgi:hypothetical protein
MILFHLRILSIDKNNFIPFMILIFMGKGWSGGGGDGQVVVAVELAAAVEAAVEAVVVLERAVVVRVAVAKVVAVAVVVEWCLANAMAVNMVVEVVR